MWTLSQVTIFPNNKPWVTKELKDILNNRKIIFFVGSEAEKKVFKPAMKMPS